GEEQALGRMRTRIRTNRNALADDAEVAAEFLTGVELFARHDLATIEPAVVVPPERHGKPFLHPDIEIRQYKDRRLEAISEIERVGRHRETLARILREQEHVLGVAMRRIRAE